jgi:hypothetical protein
MEMIMNKVSVPTLTKEHYDEIANIWDGILNHCSNDNFSPAYNGTFDTCLKLMEYIWTLDCDYDALKGDLVIKLPVVSSILIDGKYNDFPFDPLYEVRLSTTSPFRGSSFETGLDYEILVDLGLI